MCTAFFELYSCLSALDVSKVKCDDILYFYYFQQNLWKDKKTIN